MVRPAIVVLAGAALNVTIALTLALLAQSRGGPVAGLNREEGGALVVRFGLEDRIEMFSPSGQLDRLGYRERMVGVNTRRLERAEDGRPHGLLTLVEVEAGFPMRSLRAVETVSHRPRDFVQRYNRAPHVASSESATFIVPLRPIWPAFFVTSLVYVGVIMAVLLGYVAARKHIRSRRGRCPDCAYPVGIRDFCTECGAKLPATAVRYAEADVASRA